MQINYTNKLADLQPTKNYFVGIDSDGCVFDTMEIKHKRCFCPNTISYWDLQEISKYVKETWEFVNLYSKTRGCNRFNALINVIKLLSERDEVKVKNVKLPNMSPLIDWVKKETKLGNSTLEKYESKSNNPILSTALSWSLAINDDIAKTIKNIPPFPFVKKSLEKINSNADVMVISQTPSETLKHEWEENDLLKYLILIAGQEFGTKSEHIKYGAKNKYDDDKILMIGDSPGDMEAAKSNGVLFYPINPGNEKRSWERFYYEGLNKFYTGKFKGEYENKAIREFEEYLPTVPPWKK